MAQGYWNGLPTQVRRVVGTVRAWEEGDPPQAWWRDLVGQQVEAVEVVLDGVNHGGGITYLWDGDGSGWRKVTEGHGSPRYGHRNVPLVNVAALSGRPSEVVRSAQVESNRTNRGGD